MFPLMRAWCAFSERADLKRVRTALDAIPASMKDDVLITFHRVYYAMLEYVAAVNPFTVTVAALLVWPSTVSAPWPKFIALSWLAAFAVA